MCVQCLLDGCECDPAANDADTFCDIDEVCKVKYTIGFHYSIFKQNC